MDAQDSGEMRLAYGEMLSGCKNHPEDRIWYAPWKMEQKGTEAMIGDLCFKGTPQKGSVEIGYGVLPEYEGKGYTTEAVRAMVQWAFEDARVEYVEAETEPGNKASQRVLEKNVFFPCGQGAEGPRFRIKRTVLPPRNAEEMRIRGYS